MNVLERLAGYARERVEAAKAERPLAQIREEAFALPKGAGISKNKESLFTEIKLFVFF